VEFLDVVEQRRAVRHFSPETVDRLLIERLIRTAVMAPSAMNLQPWSFTVICGAERIDEYARRAREHLVSAADAPPQLTAMVGDPAFSMFYHAPVVVLVIATADSAQAREDCCLAAQTLLLAARDEGLGTCWIGLARSWLNLPQTKAELGIPAAAHVVAPIAMGFPLAWPEPHGRRSPQVRWIGP